MVFSKTIDDIRPLMFSYFKNNEENKDYVLGQNYYEWYWSYSNQIKPKNVLEIGVKWGYSSIAMGLGYNLIENLYLYDNEAKGIPLRLAVENIQTAMPYTKIFPQVLNTLNIDKNSVHFDFKFDIIHIDGGHSYQAALNDIEWTHEHLSDCGIIIVDDTKQHSQIPTGMHKSINYAIFDF